MSKYHFLRIFKTHIGKTPHRYVMQRRVTVAWEHLRESKTKIRKVDLAQELGFSDQAHFSRRLGQDLNVKLNGLNIF